MVVVFCASIWMQPYDRISGLEKICLVFSYNPNKIFFLCIIMGMGNNNNNKKAHCHI